MDMGVSGRTALVTGSTLGIGYATAVALAREGAEVVLNGRDTTRLTTAADRLRQEVPDAVVHLAPGDVGTPEGVAAIIAQAPRVDILVNNAGIASFGDLLEVPDEDWSHHFEVHVLSGLRLARHYLPAMRTRDFGRIIFTSSEAAVEPDPTLPHYSVTKAAALALARNLAHLTRDTGVTVNSVLVGPTRTEAVEELLADLDEEAYFRDQRPTALLRRLARPDEVADLVVFLASPRSALTNGAAVRAEGGHLHATI
ncbi:NAD(P)-dependent dehydrogenase (short-subunit alcohol dehydrogenase family) [Crossiella equi]|uniref:NAD(P)-dependent dehydrogenase (Short-subunit alcohol dehydrogenase family) n=1 Tax=Crossiella equi TaxID=130796 RepID=A0ABS5A711_9PSEU|nr:SDR family oxidoreductase [Crossiella equi]MBP2472387.1 NAD(P)-dependent dehydrogenase (short-subunit alcohol dehydrogenase family) [Crossiella equi]